MLLEKIKKYYIIELNLLGGLSMSAVLETKAGTITYTDEYIATLAGIAATECYGVVGMAAQKMTDGIVTLLRGENLKRGIKVNTDKSNALTIDLFVIVEYGISIGAAAQSMIETVRYHVEKATGLNVKEVNVNISGVRA